MKILLNTFRSLFLILSITSLTPARENDITINVMTYNIQRGTHYNSQTTPLAVSEIVLKNEIDLFGTQELGVAEVKLLCTYLPGYNWFGVGRDDGKEDGESGCIIYKKDKFTLLEQSTFWLSETPNVVGSKSWNTDNTRIVTWGKFRQSSDSNIVYLFNTHFDHVSSWAREESSKLLLKKIKEIAGKNPVIITGDFNFTSGSLAYQLLVDYYYNYLQVFDAKYISSAPNVGPSGTFNNFTINNPTEKIDFIFTNPFFDVMTHEVIPDKYNGEFISDHYPVKVQVKIQYPEKPKTPTLTTINGNNKVTLYWNSISEYETIETFTDSLNDFQGYKLYKSKTPDMADALLVPGSWDTPLLRKPLFECDLNDDIYGYTNYGIVNGFGYYLGNNSGIQNYFIDENVQNGETYYYVLIAYDKGIPNMADGFPPMETQFVLEVDNNQNIIYKSENVAIGKPEESFPNSYNHLITYDEEQINGSGKITVNVIDPAKLKNNSYKISFNVDTLKYYAVLNSKYRSERDVYFINSGINIYSTNNDSLIYSESAAKYSSQNIKFNSFGNYYFLNDTSPVITEPVDGFQIELNNLVETAEFDTIKSGWKTGSSNIRVTPSSAESYYFPWNFEIRFGEDFTGRTSTAKGIYDTEGNIISYAQLMLNQTYNFSAVSKDHPGENLDMVTYDANMNGVFEYDTDKILIGYSKEVGNKTYWAGTVCALSFANAVDILPNDGDTYQVFYKRPFFDSDELIFSINPEATSINSLNNNIKEDFLLSQNYPSPFNASTIINYYISKTGNYKLVVYNILGQEVATLLDAYKAAGEYSANFDAISLTSGVYIYALQGEGKRLVKKMMYIK